MSSWRDTRAIKEWSRGTECLDTHSPFPTTGDLPESIRGHDQRKIVSWTTSTAPAPAGVQGHRRFAVAGWATGMDAGDVEERLGAERVRPRDLIGEESRPIAFRIFDTGSCTSCFSRRC
jgi:hypothetical protein